jgi:hypothetical protein
MKFNKNLFIVLVLLLISCGLLPSSPTSLQLPDLVVSFINLSMVDQNGRCLNGYQIQITISNQGTATANQITAVETSTNQTILIEKLEVGERFTIYIPATSPAGTYLVDVDPRNTIPELNETNNNLSFLSPTPTPVLDCIRATPTFTPVSTLDLSTDPSLSMTLTAAPTFPSVLPLLQEALLNLTYRSIDWGEFQLVDGIFYRTSPSTTELSDTYSTRFQETTIFGDLNRDGSEDALVILGTQNGGTGHFIELAVVLNQNGIPLNVSTLYLGDR